MKKIFKKESRSLWLLLFIVSISILFFAGCSEEKAEEPMPKEDSEPKAEEPKAEEPKAEEPILELTLEELKEFNGEDGKDAYVAVDGIIYDMTNSPMWKNGDHNGFDAGEDLTDEIKNISPHGVGNLERVPEIGKIVEEK